MRIGTLRWVRRGLLLSAVLCLSSTLPLAAPAFAAGPTPSAMIPAGVAPAAAASHGPAGHAAPAGSADEAAGADAWVRIRDRKVFEMKTRRGTATPQARAKAATRLLEAAVDLPDPPTVRLEVEGDLTIVYVGKSPIAQLSDEDATASGDASREVHAAAVAAKVRAAVDGERKRKAAAETVFSISLLVFSALIAFLAVRKLAELLDRARTWLAENPDKTPELRVQGIELIPKGTLQGGLAIALGVAKILAQVGIGYGWTLFALSLFESTRPYTKSLSGAVVGPLGGLTSRVAGGLPLVVVGAVFALAIIVLLRFTDVFFQSVARGEAQVAWLPRDLATATSVVARLGIALSALLVGVPLVTGSTDGPLAYAGVIALVAVGLAACPILATGIAGIVVVYGRRLRPGDFADVGGARGRVLGVDLLEVRIDDGHGAEIRVPHLLALARPTRVVGRAPLLEVSIVASAEGDPAIAQATLLEAAKAFGDAPRVELAALDAGGARFDVTVRSTPSKTTSDLMLALAAGLRSAGIALGHHGRGGGPP